METSQSWKAIGLGSQNFVMLPMILIIIGLLNSGRIVVIQAWIVASVGTEIAAIDFIVGCLYYNATNY